MENNEIMTNEVMDQEMDNSYVEEKSSMSNGVAALLGAGVAAGIIFGGKLVKKAAAKAKKKLDKKKSKKEAVIEIDEDNVSEED